MPSERLRLGGVANLNSVPKMAADQLRQPIQDLMPTFESVLCVCVCVCDFVRAHFQVSLSARSRRGALGMSGRVASVKKPSGT